MIASSDPLDLLCNLSGNLYTFLGKRYIVINNLKNQLIVDINCCHNNSHKFEQLHDDGKQNTIKRNITFLSTPSELENYFKISVSNITMKDGLPVLVENNGDEGKISNIAWVSGLPNIVWKYGTPVLLDNIEDGEELGCDAVKYNEEGYKAIIVYVGFKPKDCPFLNSKQLMLAQEFINVPVQGIDEDNGLQSAYIEINNCVKKVSIVNMRDKQPLCDIKDYRGKKKYARVFKLISFISSEYLYYCTEIYFNLNEFERINYLVGNVFEMELFLLRPCLTPVNPVSNMYFDVKFDFLVYYGMSLLTLDMPKEKMSLDCRDSNISFNCNDCKDDICINCQLKMAFKVENCSNFAGRAHVLCYKDDKQEYWDILILKIDDKDDEFESTVYKLELKKHSLDKPIISKQTCGLQNNPTAFLISIKQSVQDYRSDLNVFSSFEIYSKFIESGKWEDIPLNEFRSNLSDEHNQASGSNASQVISNIDDFERLSSINTCPRKVRPINWGRDLVQCDLYWWGENIAILCRNDMYILLLLKDFCFKSYVEENKLFQSYVVKLIEPFYINKLFITHWSLVAWQGKKKKLGVNVDREFSIKHSELNIAYCLQMHKLHEIIVNELPPGTPVIFMRENKVKKKTNLKKKIQVKIPIKVTNKASPKEKTCEKNSKAIKQNADQSLINENNLQTASHIKMTKKKKCEVTNNVSIILNKPSPIQNACEIKSKDIQQNADQLLINISEQTTPKHTKKNKVCKVLFEMKNAIATPTEKNNILENKDPTPETSHNLPLIEISNNTESSISNNLSIDTNNASSSVKNFEILSKEKTKKKKKKNKKSPQKSKVCSLNAKENNAVPEQFEKKLDTNNASSSVKNFEILSKEKTKKKKKKNKKSPQKSKVCSLNAKENNAVPEQFEKKLDTNNASSVKSFEILSKDNTKEKKKKNKKSLQKCKVCSLNTKENNAVPEQFEKKLDTNNASSVKSFEILSKEKTKKKKKNKKSPPKSKVCSLNAKENNAVPEQFEKKLVLDQEFLLVQQELNQNLTYMDYDSLQKIPQQDPHELDDNLTIQSQEKKQLIHIKTVPNKNHPTKTDRGHTETHSTISKRVNDDDDNVPTAKKKKMQ